MNMEEAPQEFRDALLKASHVVSIQNKECEPMVMLSATQQKEWDSIQGLLIESKHLKDEGEARKSLFWVKVRRQLGEDGCRELLRIDHGIVFGSKKTKEKIPEGLKQLSDEENPIE